MKDYNLWELIAVCCQKIWQAVEYLFTFCLNTIRLSIRLWYIVLPFVALGIGLAAFETRQSNLKYKVEARLHLNGPQVADIEEAMLPLRYCNDGTIKPEQTVHEILGISFSDAVTTFAFSTINIIDSKNDSTADYVDYGFGYNRQDTVSVIKQDEACIQFVTRRPQNAYIVGNAIIDYLNNDPRLQAQYNAKKAVLEREQLFCKTQIEKLDSLTSVFYFQTSAADPTNIHLGRYSGTIVGTRKIDPLYDNMFELLLHQKKIERELATYSAPVVSDKGFLIIPIAQNKRRVWYPTCLICGYILGCLVALLCLRRKQIHNWLMKDL
ncbi:MAG: hypothetical protein IJ834_02865 [Paludibacteraceae bacterium]|nr:hypothetical protein [Paludibacteraceae bacterium]